jgi:hypothetical protein
MKTIVSIALLTLLCALGASGQSLPSNGVFAGLGFQSTANPQASGWFEVEKRLPDFTIAGLTLSSYGGAATDYFGTSTSARVDTKLVILRKGWFTAGTLQGAGAAVSPNGVGGSFVGGGWATAGIGKLLKVPGAVLAASITWQKDDVLVAIQQSGLPAKLETLGVRATFRFGVGKTWGN